MGDRPDDLTALEYGRQILEEILGWPSKGNIELMADCLTGIQKAKRLEPVQAHTYMVRAIRLGKEQGIKVDRMFFMNGEYMNVRPPAKQVTFIRCKDQKEAAASRQEYFKSAEYQAFLERMRKEHSL